MLNIMLAGLRKESAWSERKKITAFLKDLRPGEEWMFTILNCEIWDSSNRPTGHPYLIVRSNSRSTAEEVGKALQDKFDYAIEIEVLANYLPALR